MKKTILALLSLVSTSVFAGAIVSWETYSDSLLTTYEGGTAYLLQVPNGGPDLAKMTNTISTVGLGKTSDGSKITIDSLIDTSIAGGGTYLEGLDLGYDSSATFYVLFLSQDKNSFIFSHGIMQSDDDFAYAPLTQEGFPSFIEDESGYTWADYSGTVYSNAGTGGGSQGGVPEPTVLALLALGVAGVALRRKVA